MRWIVVAFLLLSFGIAGAQTDPFSALPDCGFSALSPYDGLKVGAVVYNFDTVAGCVEGLDETFQVASVLKLFVAAAYYDLASEGRVASQQSLTFTRDYWMAGQSDCLDGDVIGRNYSPYELIDLMINCSDNAATWMLMDAIGWNTVQQYVADTGISGIGTILPYSEVDKRKLVMLDPAWEAVPTALASRFYRSGVTEGLEDYFDPIPERLSRETYVAVNAAYLSSSTANTATPRALAEYLLKMRDDAVGSDWQNAIAAAGVLEVMRNTQRLASTQAFPPDVWVGAKNGFDRGVLAEVNALFPLHGDIPNGIVITLLEQTEYTQQTLTLPTRVQHPLNGFLRELSPDIAAALYLAPAAPALTNSIQLSSVRVQAQNALESCWWDYAYTGEAENAVNSLEFCWQSMNELNWFTLDNTLSVGIVLRNLARRDTPLLLVYTAPDGAQASYQLLHQYRDSAATYWYHPVDQLGEWRIDLYIDGTLTYEQTAWVGE
jgi:beta-lactamase class A